LLSCQPARPTIHEERPWRRSFCLFFLLVNFFDFCGRSDYFLSFSLPTFVVFFSLLSLIFPATMGLSVSLDHARVRSPPSSLEFNFFFFVFFVRHPSLDLRPFVNLAQPRILVFVIICSRVFPDAVRFFSGAANYVFPLLQSTSPQTLF